MSESNVDVNEGPSKSESWLIPFLSGLLIFAVSIALYYKTQEFELVYDDEHVILFNENITSLKEDPSGFKRLFLQEFWAGAGGEASPIKAIFRPKGQALYRPVFLSALGGIYYFFGEDPAPYHVANIIANALTCLLVFLTVRKLFSSTRLGFFTGLLFACHPIHTEAVAYVTGFGEVLAMLFFLLTLLFYVKASYDRDRFRFFPYLLSLAFFLIGLFTKENVVTLVGIIVLYDLIMFLQGRRPLGVVARLGMYMGYLLMVGANLAARYNVIGSLTPGQQTPIDNVIAAAGSYPVQLWTALKVLGKGIWLTILPLKLSPDYSFQAIILSLKPQADVIATVLFMLIILVFAFLSLKKRPALAFGIFWHFITISVVSNIVIIIGTIFGERLLYMPSLGFCMVLGFALDRLFSLGSFKGTRIGGGAVAASILLVAVAALGSVKTVKESKKWADNERLFQAAVKVVPKSTRVRYQLAQIYVKNKIYQEAENEYLAAIKLDKNFILVRMSLGDLYAAWGKPEQALKVFESIKMLSPEGRDAQFDQMVTDKLITLYSMSQNWEQAIGELKLRKATDNSPALNMRIGNFYVNLKDYDEAAKSYSEAWNLAPEQFEAAYKLLDIYRIKEDYAKEAELLEQLEKTDLQSNRALIYKANILFRRDYDSKAALEVLDAALPRARDDLERAGTLAVKATVLKLEFLLEEALIVLDEVLSLDIPMQGQQDALLQKLEIYKELGNWEEAEATAEKLKSKKFPLTVPVKTSLGDLYVRLKRYPEALPYLRESIAAGMKSPANFINLGKTLMFMDKYEDVVAYLTPAVEELQFEDPEIYRLLGGALVVTGEYEKALGFLKQYLIIVGRNPWVKLQIVECHLGLKHFDEVADLLQKMEADVKLEQVRPLIYHLQAKLLLLDEANRDPAKALEMAQKAIESFQAAYPEFPNGNPDFFVTLAEAYQALGDIEKARKTARQASEKFPGNKPLDTLLESLME